MQPALLGGGHDGPAQRVLGPALGGGGQPQRLPVVRVCGEHLRDGGLSGGQGARLVHDHGVDLVQALQGLGAPEEDSPLGAPARAHGNGRGRGEPEGARAGDYQHRDRGQHGVRVRRLRPRHEPEDEDRGRDGENRRHEVARYDVDESLHRRPGALGLLDEADDPRQLRLGPDPRGREPEAARRVHRRPVYRRVRQLLDRHALARQHRLVDPRAAVQHLAVDRQLLAGTDLDHVALHHVVDVDLYRLTAAHDAGRRGPEGHQRADRLGRPVPRPGLHVAPHEHEADDGR